MNLHELRVLSLDMSLRSTGYYLSDADEWGTIQNPAKTPHNDCLVKIGDNIRDLVERAELVLLEDYVPSSGGHKATHSAGELRGVVVYAISGRVPIVLVHNMTWKYQTPLARVKKQSAAEKRTYIQSATLFSGRTFETTDEADACMMYFATLKLLETKPKHKVCEQIRAAMSQRALI